MSENVDSIASYRGVSKVSYRQNETKLKDNYGKKENMNKIFCSSILLIGFAVSHVTVASAATSYAPTQRRHQADKLAPPVLSLSTVRLTQTSNVPFLIPTVSVASNPPLPNPGSPFPPLKLSENPPLPNPASPFPPLKLSENPPLPNPASPFPPLHS